MVHKRWWEKTFYIITDYDVFNSGEGALDPFGVVNNYYITSEENNYTIKSPTFSGDTTEFEWWKSNMYTHIIGIDDELWDILEDDIDIQVNGVRMVYERKSLTPTQKKIYRKHHRVRGILVDALPHPEYIKIIDKYTIKTIFKSLCATYEGNQQVKEAKANLLIQQYELFRIKEDDDIETIFFKFQILVSGLQILNKSYTTSDMSIRSHISTIYGYSTKHKITPITFILAIEIYGLTHFI